MDQDLVSVASARRMAETAFQAYRNFLGADPDAIDAMVQAMAEAIDPECERLGQLAVEETGYGNATDKRIKNQFNALSVADWLRDVKTLGLLWRDDATKVAAFGEPMGVIAALIPVTNPNSTIIFKVLSAVKAGNAIVCAPHPRAVKSGLATVEILARVAEQHGAPKGLIQCMDTITLEGTAELMRHRRTSLVLATGGSAMVKAAYSSGKPTLAVGAGNVPCYVHASKKHDLDEVAEMIITSKSFDYGTACVSEQSVIVDAEIARELKHEMKLKGAYFCTQRESDQLAGIIFDQSQKMNPDRVGQAPHILANAAQFDIPPKTRCLVSEENEIGWHRPLTAEKLNPVLAYFSAKNIKTALSLSKGIAQFQGWGHTSVIHCDDPAIIARYSAQQPTGRVLVNTPAIIGGMGYSTDLEPSFMLGTGTWSGSITSDNVTALHLINIKRVAYQNRPWRDLYNEYDRKRP